MFVFIYAWIITYADSQQAKVPRLKVRQNLSQCQSGTLDW